ncbi:hypothetical protein [Aliihoeflea sp. 2WW]|uniref:hypothetical protein n=1 Tax=Aliihoeflea sp. 2WW TaxID=1381123 RepID=UPI001268A8DF|nr:hypothetical protein [Aliihoeflea sp. 2WW]
MPKAPRENRVPIMFSTPELEAIDDWRFSNRVATRADAIRRLCQVGLVTAEKIPPLVDLGDEIEALFLEVEMKAAKLNGERDAAVARSILIELLPVTAEISRILGSVYSEIIRLSNVLYASESPANIDDIIQAIHEYRRNVDLISHQKIGDREAE